MVSVTLTIPEEKREELKRFVWINWSEVAREEFTKQETTAEAFERFKKLVSKSKLTESDAKVLADKVDKGMLKELRKQFPGL